MKIKRSYSEFIDIASDKGLQIFEGDKRSDYYHLVAIDGPITYEAFVQKDGGSDQVDFEANYLPSIVRYISEEPRWDDIQTERPTPTIELHKYYKNGVLVKTVRVTYLAADKKELFRVQRLS